MNSDNKGCSTTQAGQEQYKTYKYKDKKYVQYDYRTLDGKLFSCVAKGLAEARRRRDNWLKY